MERNENKTQGEKCFFKFLDINFHLNIYPTVSVVIISI